MESPQTLAPVAAHNVAAAMVAMYAGIIGDYERTIALLKQQLARSGEDLKKLHDELVEASRRATQYQDRMNQALDELHSLHAVQERSAASQVSCDGEPGGDQRVDGGGVGRRDEGQEAPRTKEETPSQVVG